MGEMERDPARLRVSDADRHKVAEILREAAAEGRLDFEELDERLAAAYAAKTYGDLVPITADLPTRLPGQPAQPVPQPVAVPGIATRHDQSIAVMSGVTRKGLWEVGEQHNAFALMGGVEIDLRQARFSSREITINASTIMGGVDVVVNPFTQVRIDGIGIMGAFEEGRHKAEPQLGPDSPLVVVKGLALMGGVTVTRKPMPGERKRRRALPGH